MEEQQLKKDITMFGAFSTVMGTVIGAGVFFKVASVSQAAQTPLLTLLAWFVGGILTLCAGLTSAELATAIPKTGGAIKYIEYTYGKLPGFLLGWAQTIIYFPANIAALSIIFSTQLIHLFSLNQSLLIPFAVLVGLSVTVINLLGAKVASRFQSLSLVLKLIPISLIVIFGMFRGANTSILDSSQTILPSDSPIIAMFASALFATMFAYDGWLGVGAMAGEMKRPDKMLPKAIFLGLSFITVVYVLVNLTFLRVLPFNELVGNQNAASDAAMSLFGQFGGKLITCGILISVYGALNGYVMTGIRVPFALAEENLLPGSRYLKKLSNKTKIPYVAALVQLGIAIIMMCLGSFDLLTDMLVFVMWLFSLLIFLAVFILRKREPELNRPYKVPLYPFIPLVAIIGGLFILIITLWTQFFLALTGIGLTLIGIPIFYLTQSYNRRS
ncbi:amino acid permease [Vagococcus penaei]|uniref:Amino acid permease n=1 Tax=Vagococcus penaei TaxID=633807 RepID=A0A1Q2D8G8_9ENTE|nr:amino acid permease [Vagococcus penaei]AQP54689.1 amino acid permease [Vagococcus penaei]RSU05340.1 amino acid permease [Vagococcus penaei]